MLDVVIIKEQNQDGENEARRGVYGFGVPTID